MRSSTSMTTSGMLFAFLCCLLCLTGMVSAQQNKSDVEDVTDAPLVVEDALITRGNLFNNSLFNGTSFINYMSSFMSNYLLNYYQNQAAWITYPWFGQTMGIFNTMVSVVVVGMFILVCGSAVEYIRHNHKLKEDIDYYDDNEENEVMARSSRSIMEAIDRMTEKFSSNNHQVEQQHSSGPFLFI